MLSQSVTAHQPVAANRYAGNRAPGTFHRTVAIPGRAPLSLTASKMGSRQSTVALSQKAPQGRTGNSSGLVITAATPQGNGKADNFFTQMGDKINHSIDSARNELNHIGNPQSTQYINLATGMGSIPAGHPMDQSVMQFEQIQNSVPLNSHMPRAITKGRSAKAGARRSTVMMAGPTVEGSKDLADLDEDHMDKEMLDNQMPYGLRVLFADKLTTEELSQLFLRPKIDRSGLFSMVEPIVKLV